MYKLIVIVLIFILGLVFYSKYGENGVEGYDNIQGGKLKSRCPDILIQKGSSYYLYNSKLAKVPGVNPLEFKNLDDYVEFTEWQRSQGIRCPILYLQESYDAQGNPVYKVRPSPTNLQGGLPDAPLSGAYGLTDTDPNQKLFDAGRDDPPYNNNSYPAYDQQDQYIGLNTPLDKMFNENTGGVSANPMDPNWGGDDYTQSLIDKGYYKDDEVSIRVA
jgi:hypothetical protein